MAKRRYTVGGLKEKSLQELLNIRGSLQHGDTCMKRKEIYAVKEATKQKFYSLTPEQQAETKNELYEVVLNKLKVGRGVEKVIVIPTVANREFAFYEDRRKEFLPNINFDLAKTKQAVELAIKNKEEGVNIDQLGVENLANQIVFPHYLYSYVINRMNEASSRNEILFEANLLNNLNKYLDIYTPLKEKEIEIPADDKYYFIKNSEIIEADSLDQVLDGMGINPNSDTDSV